MANECSVLIIKSMLSGKSLVVETMLKTPADYIWEMVRVKGEGGLSDFRKSLCGCRKTRNCECANTKHLIAAS